MEGVAVVCLQHGRRRGGMRMSQVTSPGNDPARPAAARIYDYLLGGKDNYAVDRDAAERVLAVAPDQRRLARANPAFAIPGVGALAEAGGRPVLEPGDR